MWNAYTLLIKLLLVPEIWDEKPTHRNVFNDNNKSYRKSWPKSLLMWSDLDLLTSLYFAIL